MVLALSGCRSLFRDDEFLPFEVPAEEFTRTDPVDFRDHAFGSGVTIEEALREIEEPLDRESRGDAIEVRIDDVRAAALRNNLDLEVELMNPLIAETSITEEEARYDRAHRFREGLAIVDHAVRHDHREDRVAAHHRLELPVH